MPFCHKCRCYQPTVDVLMNFDGTEHVIDMKGRYDGSPDVVNERATYTVPLCSVCRRPNWEAMTKTGGCTPNKERDNCPDWGSRDYKTSLKAIATKTEGIISEVYKVASVDAIQKEHKDDPKALAKAIKMRVDLLDAIARNPSAKMEEYKETPKMDYGRLTSLRQNQTITIIRMSGMASTHRTSCKFRGVEGKMLLFVPEGKRKACQVEIDKHMMVFEGDPLIRVDSDGSTFHGNALINLTDRTGMAMSGVGGLGKSEPMLNSMEVLRDRIDRHNLNPLTDKGIIVVWTEAGLANDTPTVLYPELADKCSHAVLERYMNKENDECKKKTDPTQECGEFTNAQSGGASKSTAAPSPMPPAPAKKNAAPKQEPPSQPAKVAATSSTGCSEGQAHIETHVHMKKNFQYHIVVPHSRVSREEWESMTGKARAVGGWYGNKYKDVPGGYCFKDKRVAEQFMADHFAEVSNMVEQPKAEPKREKMGPLATCHVNRSPNVMHVASACELYGPGVIESDDHGDQVIARLMASGIDWNLPLEKLQENPAIESIVTEALKEKEAPEPEPVAEVAPESNVVKVDFSTPDADLELQEALALAERL